MDEAIYTSPIDEVDEVVFFVQNFKGMIRLSPTARISHDDAAFAERDVQPYMVVLGGLAADEKNFVTTLIQLAHEKAAAK